MKVLFQSVKNIVRMMILETGLIIYRTDTS